MSQGFLSQVVVRFRGDYHYVIMKNRASMSNRQSGGIALYVKNNLISYVKVVMTECNFILFCVNWVNIYKSLLRGSVFRVNIYCILRQEPLQKTLCESILFIFSPYCTWCSPMRIKLSRLVTLFTLKNGSVLVWVNKCIF